MGYAFARLMRTRARYALVVVLLALPLGLAGAYYSAGGIPTDGGHDHWNPFGSTLAGAVLVFAIFAAFLAAFAWISTTALRIFDEGRRQRERQ